MRTRTTIGASLLLSLTCPGGAVVSAETINVEKGGNRATVRQNGSSTDERRSIETRPSYTRIEQRSHNNSAVIVQDSGPSGPGDE